MRGRSRSLNSTRARQYPIETAVRDSLMFSELLDHGLPLVSLKEQRRDLIVALLGRHGPLSKEKIGEIAAIQQAIAAIEA